MSAFFTIVESWGQSRLEAELVRQDVSALLEALEAVPDPRDPRGVVYDLAMLLGLGVFAAACQATTFDEIAETVGDADAYVLAGFGLMPRRVPSLATFRRVLCDVDPDALDETLSAWTCDMKPAPTAADAGAVVSRATTMSSAGMICAQVP